MNEDDFEVTVKNSVFGLPDLPVRIRIDRQARLVTLDLDLIDSALIVNLATRILPLDHGVIAYCEDRVGEAPRRSAFGLRIRFDRRYFGAQVFRLAEGAFSLRMEDSDMELQRMARTSAERVLGGLLFDSRLSTTEGALDVFVRGPHSEARIQIAQDILDSRATVPMYLLSERQLAKAAVERAFLRPHLPWDAGARRCVAGPADRGWS